MTEHRCPGCGDVVNDDDTVQVTAMGATWHARCKDHYDTRKRRMSDIPQSTATLMSPPVDRAETLLQEALKIVTGARRQTYGTPEDNFGCIARLWNTYLTRRVGASADPKLAPGDVAVMMVLMKCARLAEAPDHHDSAVDIAGYAACLARCQTP